MTENEAMKIILAWKEFWMDQKGTNEEDRSDYIKRALGVDSNMMHDLAFRLENSTVTKRLEQEIGYALERQDYATKRWVTALNQIVELQGVLDLKNDEYVRQVGTWKIISRLEEQLKLSKMQTPIYKEALELIADKSPTCDCMHAPDIAKHALNAAKEFE